MKRIVSLIVLAAFLVACPESLTSSDARDCCKVCRKGKACGDSCIEKAKECHEPPGCACDG